MDATTNNKLIAEFMGYEIQKDPTERFFGRYKTPITKVWVKENELSFDSDWNWLMPVCNKCEEIASNNYDIIKWIRNNYSIFDLKVTEATLEMVYKNVVTFIKWYNGNK